MAETRSRFTGECNRSGGQQKRSGARRQPENAEGVSWPRGAPQLSPPATRASSLHESWAGSGGVRAAAKVAPRVAAVPATISGPLLSCESSPWDSRSWSVSRLMRKQQS